MTVPDWHALPGRCRFRRASIVVSSGGGDFAPLREETCHARWRYGWFGEIDGPRRGVADRHGAGGAGAIRLAVAGGGRDAGASSAPLWAKARRRQAMEATALSGAGRLCDERE